MVLVNWKTPLPNTQFRKLMYTDHSLEEVDQTMQQAWKAFHQFRKVSLKDRANFMRSIAKAIEEADAKLIEVAMQETNLPEARLKNGSALFIFKSCFRQVCFPHGNLNECCISFLYRLTDRTHKVRAILQRHFSELMKGRPGLLHRLVNLL